MHKQHNYIISIPNSISFKMFKFTSPILINVYTVETPITIVGMANPKINVHTTYVSLRYSECQSKVQLKIIIQFKGHAFLEAC